MTTATYPAEFFHKVAHWEGSHTSYTWQRNGELEIIGETAQFYVLGRGTEKGGKIKKTNVSFLEPYLNLAQDAYVVTTLEEYQASQTGDLFAAAGVVEAAPLCPKCHKPRLAALDGWHSCFTCGTDALAATVNNPKPEVSPLDGRKTRQKFYQVTILTAGGWAHLPTFKGTLPECCSWTAGHVPELASYQKIFRGIKEAGGMWSSCYNLGACTPVVVIFASLDAVKLA